MANYLVTAQQLEENLQDLSKLNWYIVPIFVIVAFIGACLVKKKLFNILFGAVAFWAMDVFNETWNSMVYATTGSPVWGTIAQGNSAYQILIGYNIEICFMFFILGMFACLLLKTSPDSEGINFFDGNKNWLADPNNLFYKANKRNKDLTIEERKTKRKAILGRIIPALVGSVLAVIVEIILNKAGVLTWDKSWWQSNVPYLIFIIGYCPFFFSAVVIHDLPRKWQLIGLGSFIAFVALLIIVTGSMGMLGPQIPLNFPFK